MTFYSRGSDGTFKIGDGFSIGASTEDLEKGYIDVPLAIAIRNVGDRSIDGAKMTVQYPAGLNVQGKGRPKIDPSGHTLIYEKPLEVIEKDENYTVIEPVDTLRIRIIVVEAPVVALSRDDVPFYFAAKYFSLVASSADVPPSGITEEVVHFGIKIVERNGDTIDGVAELRVPSKLEINPYGVKEEVRPVPAGSDVENVLSLLRAGDVSAAPLVREIRPGKVIRYEERSLEGKVFGQLVYVNDALKVAYVDKGDDGHIDYRLIDPDGNGTFDSKGQYMQPFSVTHWSPEAFAR
ncbi:hypothetical protein U2F26_35590 [Micromonospora sp. 4G57]|uniref:Uncharacterized protein n=1 Tax=Micromonospora sicca TaxID=2202420 RepID=A0ABU5JQ19_9ACTN|nr:MULTISPECIES: hypothetical protein [unclassified Micromonospora]MDZ5447953.1 hypothetical protein [Micromonospora sp. 4G57]MDZ5494691.1 hypothetical protein [Micromonospora sp. 4G53]